MIHFYVILLDKQSIKFLLYNLKDWVLFAKVEAIDVYIIINVREDYNVYFLSQIILKTLIFVIILLIDFSLRSKITQTWN